MANPIFHLYHLQKLDSRLDYVHNRIAQIESVICSDLRIKHADESLSQKKTAYREVQGQLRAIEEVIKEKQIKIEQSEASLYGGGVKNPKELQDIQKEISSIKLNIAKLEDTQLEIMMEVEAAEKSVIAADEELTSITSQVSGEHSQLIIEKDALEKDLLKLSTERSAIANQIHQEELLLYESLRKKNKGIAVAVIEDNCCSACGVELTPAECQAAKSPSSIKYCSSCGRILYAG